MKNKSAFFFCFILSAFSAVHAQSFKELAIQFSEDNSARLFAQYQQLHAHPETSTHEKNTSGILRAAIREMGYQIMDSMGYYSFAGWMKNGNGPVLLYRTEMDGLPVLENTGLTYASKDSSWKDGVRVPAMHACGHDIHMTTWLGLAKFLALNKKYWNGTVIFLAQSAEETAQGAKAILASNAFSQLPTPDLQFAIHDHADLPSGQFGFCNGYAMASVDMLDITVFGIGGHGAAPQNTIDPVLLSAQFINAIQSIVSRNLSSNDPAVITVGAIHGGTAGNVIPDKVELKLTIRSYTEESRKLIFKRIKEIGDHLARSAGLSDDKLPKYTLLDMSIPAVYNTPEWGNRIQRILNKNFGDSATTSIKPLMIGEDFSVYGQRPGNIPSYILWAGTANPALTSINGQDKTYRPSLHSARFAPDAMNTIKANVSVLATCMLELLKR